MSTLFLFGILVIALSGGTVATVRRGHSSPQTAWTTLTLWGVGLTAGALFLLPWLSFRGADYFDAQANQVVQHSLFRTMEQHAPSLRPVWLSATSDVAAPAAPSGDLASLVRTRIHLTGFEVVRLVPQASSVLKTALGLLGLLAGVALLGWAAAQGGFDTPLAQGALVVQSLGAGMTFFVLLWYVPVIDSLGIRDDFTARTLFFLAGAQTGPGIWAALLGVLLLAIAGTVGLGLARDRGSQEIQEWDWR